MFWRRGSESLVHLLHSFSYAAQGVGRCVLEEQNFRLQLILALCALLLGRWMPLVPLEWAVLWAIIGLVLGAELANTAVEAVVDLVTDRWHPLAKLAKDCAAGAALVAALASLAVGWQLFWRPDRLLDLVRCLCESPIRLAACLGAGVLAIWFILIGPTALWGDRGRVRRPPAERNRMP